MPHNTEPINALKTALIDTKARLYQIEDGMGVDQSQIHAKAFVDNGIRQLMFTQWQESHNATPAQHENATDAENSHETDT